MRHDCINLEERFGDRYRVEFEESYYAERPEFRQDEAPWLMIIPCEHGHICPWGESTLAACTNFRGRVANRLKALPFTDLAQEGADGVNVLFDVKHLDQVAKIMNARRRRGRNLLPESEKQKLIGEGRKYGFFTGKSGAHRTRRRDLTPKSTFGSSRPNSQNWAAPAADFPSGV